MNRNSQAHFAVNPNVDIKRSVFDRSFDHKTTFNTGEIVPFFLDEVLPGDTFKIKTNFVVRMSTPIHPVLDNLYLDTFYFFVPNRLIWTHWKEFQGENNMSYWDSPAEYQVPQISSLTGFPKGSLMDYLGIPTEIGSSSIYFNHLPIRAYCLIWNEYFRDQNTMQPISITKGDATVNALTSSVFDSQLYPSSAQNGYYLMRAARFHDYFSSALPEPQKGDPVTISLLDDSLPITVGDTVTSFDGQVLFETTRGSTGNFYPLGISISSPGSGKALTQMDSPTSLGGSTTTFSQVTGSNLVADLTGTPVVSINELRQAFQLQKMLEKDARGGTRYTEILKTHFGVTSPDARLQRPEYLGGKRIPINISQVLQTSSTDETSPQGNTAAYSLTVDSDDSFTKSFVEHGYILGLAVIRPVHTYQYGVEPMWLRKKRTDFYMPVFASIGEQPILNSFIYLSTNQTQNNEVFGYQEAWADYRYKPNRVSGAFRSNYAQSLDVWHYADKYSSLPTLSAAWMFETPNNVDRTLAVGMETEDQFIADFYVENICTRPMPLYSIPGLIDHY